MDLRHLRTFAKVAEAKGFTRAAELLHIAQPALSLHIRQLEEELGCQLVVRHSRGIELTHAGEKLLRHANDVLERLDLAARQVRDLGGEANGTIRLGMQRSTAEMVSVELLRLSAERLPKVTIKIAERMSEQLHHMMIGGELDMSFTYDRRDPIRLQYESLLNEKLCFAEKGGGPDRSNMTEMTFLQVLDRPLILPARSHPLRAQLEEMARSMRRRVNILHEIDTVNVIASLVEAGLGGTVLPLSIIEKSVAAGRLTARKIVAPELTRHLYLSYQTSRSWTKAHFAVRDLLIETVRAYVQTKMPSGLVSLEG